MTKIKYRRLPSHQTNALAKKIAKQTGQLLGRVYDDAVCALAKKLGVKK